VLTNKDYYNPESLLSRTFKIVTKSRSYTLQAESASQLSKLKLLIDSIIQFRSQYPSYSESVDQCTSNLRFESWAKYEEDQRIWKKELHFAITSDLNFKKGVVTLKLNSRNQIEVHSGFVIQPPAEYKAHFYRNTNNRNRSRSRSNRPNLPTLSTIDAQILELDDEMAKSNVSSN
jgi:hypothetical protein